MSLTKEQIKEFDKHNHWLEFASKCKHVEDPPYVSIPSLLSKCGLINDACRFENCPKREENAVELYLERIEREEIIRNDR